MNEEDIFKKKSCFNDCSQLAVWFCLKVYIFAILAQKHTGSMGKC